MVIEAGGERLLVDAGLSAKRIGVRLGELGLAVEDLSAVLLTHEHGDHIAGLRVLMKRVALPVYATSMTARVVREAGVEPGAWRVFEAGQEFRHGGVEIGSFGIQHDAVDPVGYVLGCGGVRFGVVSDVGHVPAGVALRLRGLHGLFVEANYDEKMLEEDTKRPWSTKQRISSRHGHLSNTQAAELVGELAHGGLNRVVLGHLSRDCNAPEVAVRVVRERLQRDGWHTCAVECAPQDGITPWWTLGGSA